MSFCWNGFVPEMPKGEIVNVIGNFRIRQTVGVCSYSFSILGLGGDFILSRLDTPPVDSRVDHEGRAVHFAWKGGGADDKKIISITGHRNAVQRKLIRQAYEETYQEDMIKRFESELHANFEKAMFRWVLNPFDRDAVLANEALKESNPDYHVIVELSCIYSPDELLAVKRAYQACYHHCLEEDLASHISGDLGKFLVALVGVYWYDGGDIDPRLAKSEAVVLHNAIKDKNHEEMTRIVGTRRKAQLIATFNGASCGRFHHEAFGEWPGQSLLSCSEHSSPMHQVPEKVL